MTDKLIERIKARVADGYIPSHLEDRILSDAKIIEAAEELAKQADGWLNGGSGRTYDGSLSDALADFRAAVEEARQ